MSEPSRERYGFSNIARQFASVASRDVVKVTQRYFGGAGAGRIVDLLNDVLQQRYSGDVSIFPKHTPMQLMRMFSNPTAEDIRRYIREGERATWPKLERIRMQTRLSRVFEDCVAWLKEQGLRRTPPRRRVLPIRPPQDFRAAS